MSGSIAANPSELAVEFREKGKSDACPVIDMHGHYGPFQGIHFPSPYAEGMLHSMDRCGVVTNVISGHFALNDSERGNEEISEVVRKYPSGSVRISS